MPQGRARGIPEGEAIAFPQADVSQREVLHLRKMEIVYWKMI